MTMPEQQRKTVRTIAAAKGGRPLVCLTAHSAPMAALIDPHADIILVGDSLGPVVHGLPDTLGVTMDMMLMHARAVMRGSRQALVVVDMPFGSYQDGWRTAFANAARLVGESGAQAVKLECGSYAGEIIAALVARGIAVMGHVGLLPQEIRVEGGYVVQGRSLPARREILARARAADDAGAFAVVVEGVYEDVAAEITSALRCPVIGIGASARCDGQVLVTEDMLGMFDRTARFVRRYGRMKETITTAVEAFARDVKERTFPGRDETYGPATREPVGKQDERTEH